MTKRLDEEHQFKLCTSLHPLHFSFSSALASLQSQFHTCFQWLSATRLHSHFHAALWFCGPASTPQRLAWNRLHRSAEQRHETNEFLCDWVALRWCSAWWSWSQGFDARGRIQEEKHLFLISDQSAVPSLLGQFVKFTSNRNHGNTLRRFSDVCCFFTNYLLWCWRMGVEDDDEDHRSVEAPPTTYIKTRRTAGVTQVFFFTRHERFSQLNMWQPVTQLIQTIWKYCFFFLSFPQELMEWPKQIIDWNSIENQRILIVFLFSVKEDIIFLVLL